MPKEPEPIDVQRAVTLFCHDVFDTRRKRGDSYAKLAKEFAVSKTWVQHIHKDPWKHGVGNELEETLARKFYGGSVDALRIAAVNFVTEKGFQDKPIGVTRDGSAKGQGVDVIRRYSNAQLAAEYVARETRVSRDKCMAAAAHNSFGLAPDAGIEDWRSAIKLSLLGPKKKVLKKSR